MLIENYLWCVVSLPAGCFNPYSGVKTSVLLMDKSLTKRIDEILFVKIENDGFDLGAQRRAIDKNDLPEALRVIADFRLRIEELRTSTEISDTIKPTSKIAQAVKRTKILKSPDCNLSGDRYKDNGLRVSTKWPMARLGEVADIISGQSPEGQFYNSEGDGLPFYQGKADFGDKCLQEPSKWTTQTTKVSYQNDILMSVRAPVGPVNINPFRQICIGRGLAAIRAKTSASYWYLFYILQGHEEAIRRGCGGSTFESINRSQIENIKIPLPPLDVQEKIVAELDGYRKIIEGAKQVVANYKPTIRIDPGWQNVPMGEVCDVRDGTHDSPRYHLKGFPLITSKNIREGGIDFSNADLISKEDLDKINKRSQVDEGDILMPMIGTIGNPIVVKKDREFAVKNVALIKFHKSSTVGRHYLKAILESEIFTKHLLYQSQGSSQKFVSLGFLRSLLIPLPPLDIQRQIVAEIEAEQALVEANRKLIEVFERKIQAKLAEIWGEEANGCKEKQE
jgi:type I restriction enzyme M protein